MLKSALAFLLVVSAGMAAPSAAAEDAAKAGDEAVARAEMVDGETPLGAVVNDGKVPDGGVPVFGADIGDALRKGSPSLSGQIVVDDGQIVLHARRSKTSFKASNVMAVGHGDVCFWDITLQAAAGAAAPTSTSGRILAEGLLWPVTFSLKPGEACRFVHHAPAWKAGQPNSTAFQVELAEADSEIAIKAFTFLSFGKRVKEGELPYRRVDYAGRAADASWRRKAEERIRQHRTSPVTVVVRDQAGQPVSAADVRVEMIRHRFPFGTAVGGNWLDLSNTSADATRYRKELVRLFNAAGMENLYKWRSWDTAANRDKALRWTDWLVGNGLPLRGHVMVWPSWEKSPPRMKIEFDRILGKEGAEAAKTWLATTLRDHIRDIGGTLGTNVFSWDVINETAANRDFMRILGAPAMAEWFRLARDAAPHAQLLITENSLLTGRKIEHFLHDAKLIQDAGAPITGLGAQGHIGIMEPETILDALDRLSSLGLPVTITEFDVKAVDKNLQGEMLRDAMIALFSHPSVNGIMTWGFWDGQHWLSDAPLFYRDWTPKPGLRSYEDLVFGAWWTRAAGRTDAAGMFRTTAFHGRHAVSVRHAGRDIRTEVEISTDTGDIVIVL